MMASEYTKHYYTEGQRIASKIGAGLSPSIVPYTEKVEPITHDTYEVISDRLYKLCQLSDGCVGFNGEYTNYGKTIKCVKPLVEIDNEEKDRYFYHSDHIGSSSFITDRNGYASQHLQYLPFGELFVEQRSTANYYTPYKFSGKEKDEETSYSYFGARYYMSDVSVWLSVDPLADDAPGWTPYRYCFNNPINLIDPNGMSEVDGEGIPTKYYDQKGTLIEDVNDGIDQSVEVNREQYQAARSAYNGNNSFKNQKDGALFTHAYAGLAKKFGQPYTVKGNWSSVNDVLAGKKHISYSSQGDCNKAARAQNEVGNASPGGADSRIDIALNGDGRIIPVSGNLMRALKTTHYNLNRGYPVMVGVNRENNPDMGNYNSATNHFINIVGRGNDYYGNYFNYRDNAFEGGGRLYLNNGFIQSITTNGYLTISIIVTEVRPNVSYR